MNKPEIVIAIYRPLEGKSSELESLVKKHFPTLKSFGLTTDKDSFIGRTADGSFIEIFEWISSEAAESAHDHPGVAKVWEAMGEVCSFGKLSDLTEARSAFPHFQQAF